MDRERVGMQMIQSGSHVPGVSVDDFGLPDHTALRWELPAEPLRAFLLRYGVFDSDVVEGRDTVDWMLPAWARIWIAIGRAPVTLAIHNRSYESLPAAGVFGVTSRAIPVRANGGVTIAIDVSPLGWSRLFTGSAAAYRDTVTPLGAMMPEHHVTALTAALAHSDRALDVKPILDRFFAPLLAGPHRHDASIAKLSELVADARTVDLEAVAAAQGISAHAMRRMSNRYFGFSPKLLICRTRFLRALMPLLEAGADADYGAIPPGYHDRSHFNRDGRRFLGMTPRRYIAQPAHYMTATRRARRMVIGSPVAVLDPFRGL